MVPPLLSLVAGLLLSATVAASPTALEKRQCTATLNTAMSVAETLQAHYFDASSGMYNGGSLWTDANTLEDLHNLMLATGTDQFSAVADQSFLGRSTQDTSAAHWQGIFNGANDDALWIVLSLWKMADYKVARGIDATAYWSGGAPHTITRMVQLKLTDEQLTNKSAAITNQLFLLTSAEGAIRFPSQSMFLPNAIKTWNWLRASGMRNSQGLWNDGLTLDTCVNNGQTTWTYNQGVIASGLSSLALATGNTTLLAEAQITLDATIAHLSENNILKETCDNAAAGGSVCDADQQLFKGLWTKHLQYFLDRANSPALNSKYSGFLGSQSSAVFHFGTDANNDVGSVWYAPNAGGSIFTPKTSASGLEAHVADAKYGPC
ncbi:unnamed protein product [Mycena citricolor]|uniref:Glycoside hydrolase family 76 protein n=1 Tax=Mycena citricolor TaxID=2018698 RepID=A0AAD2GYT3_9AGAR|nr:unnamed protein product [Mycena citricolor]CAK5281522.1 unnamed protein product [Mycena citricolor]